MRGPSSKGGVGNRADQLLSTTILKIHRMPKGHLPQPLVCTAATYCAVVSSRARAVAANNLFLCLQEVQQCAGGLLCPFHYPFMLSECAKAGDICDIAI